MRVYIYSAKPFISAKRNCVRWTSEFTSYNQDCKRKKQPIYRRHFKIKWKRISYMWWISWIKRNTNKNCSRHNLIIKMRRISTLQTIMEWFCSLLITLNPIQRLPHQTSKLIYSIFSSNAQNMCKTEPILWLSGENEFSRNIFNCVNGTIVSTKSLNQANHTFATYIQSVLCWGVCVCVCVCAFWIHPTNFNHRRVRLSRI